MFSWFTNNPLWELVKSSDFVTWLILLTLLFLSICCWTILFFKLALLRKKQRELEDATRDIKRAQSIEELVNIVSQQKDTLPAYFLSKDIMLLKHQLEANRARGVTSLTPAQYEFFTQEGYGLIDDIVKQQETLLPFLSTTAAISPLLGLFGTIWGLIHSFVRMSQQQSADITTVAPGIAEALITTLVGLIVAIPALIIFNYLQSRLRSLEHALIGLADKVNQIVKLSLVQF